MSADGWARFEHRARLRRIDKRAEAARSAIGHGRFGEAAAAIEEIRAIDATHPDIISLTMELDAAQQFPDEPWFRVGPAFAAVMVFAALVLGARWLGTPDVTSQAPVREPVSTQAAPAPAPASTQTEVMRADDVATDPDAESSLVDPDPPPAEPVRARAEPAVAVARPEPVAASRDDVVPPAAERPFVWPPPTSPAGPAAAPISAALESDAGTTRGVDAVVAPPPAPPAVAPPALTAGAPPRAVPAETLTPQPPAVAQPEVALASSTRAPAAPVAARDEELVRRALQHYRLAYESLDARSARTVWPAVNEAALQRAFDGLVSQQLTFSDCNVEVRGAAGSAVCRGSARYVPKVGSRDARVEPRVWNFSLRKAGDDWQIESARTER